MSNRKKLRRVTGGLTAVAVGAGLAVVAAGCSVATPAISQCAVVTGHGFGDGGQGIQQIAHPGDYINIGNGSIAWYWPCNARNFVISPPGQPGDYHTPISVRTAPQGQNPGMPVNVWLAVYFTPNTNDDAMKKFLPFCLKYGCAVSSDQVDNSIETDPHFSTAGWEGMLLENYPLAIQRAATDVIAQFGPDLWSDPSQWPKLGDLIAQHLNTELSTETENATPFFCGSGSTQGTCTQMTVAVSKVEPADPAVVQLYNEKIAAEQALAVNAARLAAAQQVYGPYAQYFLGLQDLASECKTCTIYVGAPGTIPSAVPAPVKTGK